MSWWTKMRRWVVPVAGFFLGAGALGQAFFHASSFMAGLYGMSLATTIGGMLSKPKEPGMEDYSRFDRLNNAPSSEAMIPVIYGERKWAGTTLYHKNSADNKVVTKDILIGEGEIEGVSEVKFNDIFVNSHGVLSVKCGGNGRYATFSKDNHSVSLIFPKWWKGTNTLVFPYTSTTTMQDLAIWINQHPPWSAVVLSKTATIKNIPNGNIDCKSMAYLGVNAGSGLPGCSYVFHSGSKDQGAPDKFDVVGGYKNCAWLRTTMTASDKLSGDPTITYVAKGIKVDTLDGGAKIWSDNPAYCTLDFLTNRRYGLGNWIKGYTVDYASFVSVAAHCNEAVETKMPDGAIMEEPRYRLNIILDQKRSAIDHLNEILMNFGGFLTFTNNSISLRVERSEQSVYSFTDATIVKDSVGYTQMSIEETPNKFLLGFFDPAQNWTQTKVISEDTVDQQSRSKIIKKEVVLAGCTSQSQALRVGRLYRDIGALCSWVIQFSTGTYGKHLEAGDIIDVTYRNLFTSKPFRILEISEVSGIIQIKAREYNASVYNDSLGAEMQVKDYVQLPNPMSDQVPDVINLDILESFRELGNGIVTSDVEVTWSSLDIFYKEAEVYVLSDNPTWAEIDVSANDLDGTWESIGQSSGAWKLVGKGADRLFMTNLVRGLSYTFKVVSVNSVNRKANFDTAPTVAVTIKSKTYTPQTPRGLQVSITDKCEWYWNALGSDCDFAELRMDTNTGSTTGLLAKTSSTKATVTPLTRHGIVYLYAHNTAGYYSDPCVLEYNKALPVAPSGVVYTQIFQGVTVTTAVLPLYCLGINVHANDGAGNKVFFGLNNVYTMKTTGGIFDMAVAYVDIFGEGVLSPATEVIVKATIDPKFLAAESLSLDKMDKVVKDAVAKAQVSVDTTIFNAIKDTLVKTDTDNATAIQQTSDHITQAVKDVNGQISEVKQVAIGLTSTVQSNKADADGKVNAVGSRIDQQAMQITSVVNGLAGANTAIAQTDYAVQLRATKADLISLINVCPEAVSIKSKLIHIAGDTVIDGNIISTGMLQNGSVSTEKMVAGSVTAEKISVTLAEIKGKLTAAQIDAGVIDAGKITTGELNASLITTGTLKTDLIYQAGYQVKANVMVRGVISHGKTIPLPSGYTQDQCVWGILGEGYNWKNDGDRNGYETDRIVTTANQNRLATIMAVSTWVTTGDDAGTHQYLASYGTANYWIMGVK